MRIHSLLLLPVFLAACSTSEPPAEDVKKDEAAATPGSSTSASGETPTSTATDTSAKPAPATTTSAAVADVAKKKAELLTSIWENGTTVLQYGYCENINDGRGYTSGRAGFCSGTGDAILVVQCVAAKEKDAKIAKYLSALQSITKTFEDTGEDQASTSKLDKVGNYCADWSASAESATFRACQDQIVADAYFKPALAQASKLGLSTALTIAALYDAEINHGDDGTNGVGELVAAANKKVEPVTGPRTIEQESKWLEAFLSVRIAVLNADPTWTDSVDRVAVYESLRRAGNFDLSKPITTDAKASALFPGETFADSGYPKCTIAADGAVSGDADCTNAKPADDGGGDDDDDDK